MTDVSPEVLSKLAELVKATSGVGGNAGLAHDPRVLDYLKIFGELLNAVAWPIAAVYCVILFRQQLTQFIGDVDSVNVGAIKISRKITSQIEQSAQEAETKTEAELRSGPSKDELVRATIVKQLAAETDRGLIARQAEALAMEYERVRASMLPGNPRTRAMEVVVSKMRTIGQAFFPLRHNFAASPSPGKRLMVIASLEVAPDYDMIDWLAERAHTERPFLQYHALVAMLLAAQRSAARAYIGNFETAIAKLTRYDFGGDSSRVDTLAEIKKTIESLKVKAK